MIRSVDCTAAMRQLWDYLDGELTSEQVVAMRAHLEACARCYPHYNFARVFLESLASTRSVAPAPRGLRARVVQTLRETGFAPG